MFGGSEMKSGRAAWVLQQSPPVMNVLSLLRPCHTAGLPWREICRTNLVHSADDIARYTCVLCPIRFFVFCTSDNRKETQLEQITL